MKMPTAISGHGRESGMILRCIIVSKGRRFPSDIPGICDGITWSSEEFLHTEFMRVYMIESVRLSGKQVIVGGLP